MADQQQIRIDPRRTGKDARVKGQIRAALKEGKTVIAARPNGRFYGVDLGADDRLVFQERPASIPLGVGRLGRPFSVRRDHG